MEPNVIPKHADCKSTFVYCVLYYVFRLPASLRSQSAFSIFCVLHSIFTTRINKPTDEENEKGKRNVCFSVTSLSSRQFSTQTLNTRMTE